MIFKKKINKILDKWYVSYDPYSDMFQMYDGVSLRSKKSGLLERQDGDFRLLYANNGKDPVLVEFSNAYSKFGCDVNSIEKAEIIKKVKPLIKSYI